MGSEPGTPKTPKTLVSSTTEPLSPISMVHIALITTKFYMYLFQIDIVNVNAIGQRHLSSCQLFSILSW